jgi:GT2 family glycosyltransferase
MGDVKFSVVVPTRNRDELLARCLEGLHAQRSRVPLQIVVTDDGRSAATRAMVSARFAGVEWTAGPQRGPAANRNHGASLAQGSFILFIDDDVEPDPGLIEGYDAAIVDDVHVYEGRTTCRAGLHSPMEHSPVNETGGWLWSCNMMVRRTFWQSFGGFDEAFPYAAMEDAAFRERLRRAEQRFLFVPAATVDHPPRRQPSGRALGRLHESEVIYRYKYLGEAPSWSAFSMFLLRHRMRHILHYRPSVDTARAVISLGSELWYVARNWKEWDRRWRHAGSAALHD